MNILLISNGYPPHRWAGTETYSAGIAEELHKRGHKVSVICVGEWDEGDQYWNGYADESINGVEVRRINLNWLKAPDPFRYLYKNPFVADFLSGYLDELKPDVVHVTSCETLSASVLEVVKKAGIPQVLSITDFWFLCPSINLLRSDGEICDGNTTPWECLQCELSGSKAYRWSHYILGDYGASRVLTQISKHPLLTRQRGLRGRAGDMAARKRYLRQALNWPDLILTASQFVHDIYVENGIRASIEVHPYGHDLSWLKNYKGKTQSDLIRFGFIGQLIKIKGVHLLLEAAQSLQSELGDKFSLSIYGSIEKNPDYSGKLLTIANGIKNVKFLGTYDHKESAKVFANIDILVVPSIWYDFPLVIQESFAANTPVIATNLGGMSEAITHEINGLLFERGNVADLAIQIKRICDQQSLIEKLRIGIPTVKSIDEELNELEITYGKLVSSEVEKFK